jgi:hypothetical protein
MGYDPRSEEEVTKFAVQTALDIIPNHATVTGEPDAR